ncbi:IS66 family insertion sequence element accessory protein TnpB [Sphingobacterium composti Ten et al. 2007 non Yoo et al. 2007]|uniref:IS66 family insertion sequence element accessory protein TnpB n=1 Tax=Sphingobacterium composti TaxID=363260 RepID=UPI00135903EA
MYDIILPKDNLLRKFNDLIQFSFIYKDGHCDMRKSFDGLCGLIISVMQRQPTSGEVFVFLNRSRTHIKLLHWEHGGFVLYYKRLESGTFGTSALNKVSYRGAI